MPRYEVICNTPNGPMLASIHATRCAADYKIRRNLECYRERGRKAPTYIIAEVEGERRTLISPAPID